MSVLKNRRHQSPAKFVQIANEIFVDTYYFLSRLSARQQRIFAEGTGKLALEVVDYAEKGNSTMVKDEITYNIRTAHFLEAIASVEALDVNLTHIWQILMTNPQGAFTDSNGKTKSTKEAEEILEKMADRLGANIDLFRNYLNKIITNEREKYKYYVNKVKDKSI